MKRLLALPLLLTVALLGSWGCSSFVKTKTEEADSAAWGNYRTYSWLEPIRGQEGQSSPFVRRVVDVELQAKGYQLARPGEEADLMVGEHISTTSELAVRQVNEYYGISRASAGFEGGDYLLPDSGSAAYVFERGQLILSVVDGRTKELIWRGVGEGKVLINATLEKREQRIEGAVQRLVRRIPAAS